MRKPAFELIAAIITWLFAAPAAYVAVRAEEPQTLRIMTFNIRYDNPGDGENGWANRKDKVASMVRLYEADAIGMQEALRNQIDDLAMRLPEYDWFGVGRQDGKDSGEFGPIFYRRSRLELLEKQTFWLSPTPDKIGSRGWDAALPRIVTWGQFKDRSTGHEFYLFNTHFDHVGIVARFASARLLRSKAAGIAGVLPLVVMGDLNCTADSPPYQWLVGKAAPASEKASPNADANADARAANEALADAMLLSRNPHHGPTTTWNGFKALVPGQKIDHIFVRGLVDVEQHAVLSDHWDGRFPSDHLPVMAEVIFGNINTSKKE
jgi:endonuclease/exonuclease/phosphatase family metal-dependent hydrolase